MSSVPRFDALSLDVGGVLVVPDHGMIARVLDLAGVPYERERFWHAHYLAMAEVDRCTSVPEDFTDYLRAFFHAIEVPRDRWSDARVALEVVFETPLWCQPVPGSRAALRALAAAGVRLAVTSNSDGSITDLLARHEVVQVGDGHGVAVEWISDSGTLGVAKPDPAIFASTVGALGLEPAQVLHVGDSVHYDVHGATAAGLQAAHFDPHGSCADGGHRHVRSLGELCGTRPATPA